MEHHDQLAGSWLRRRRTQLTRCALSVRPRSGERVPHLTVQVARASSPRARRRCGCGTGWTGCGTTRTSSAGTRAGRPGLSPAQLATVCVLQFLLGLPDRQAAEAVRCPIDFKYALALELGDPGFDHSVVLADFHRADPNRAQRMNHESLGQGCCATRSVPSTLRGTESKPSRSSAGRMSSGVSCQARGRTHRLAAAAPTEECRESCADGHGPP